MRSPRERDSENESDDNAKFEHDVRTQSGATPPHHGRGLPANPPHFIGRPTIAVPANGSQQLTLRPSAASLPSVAPASLQNDAWRDTSRHNKSGSVGNIDNHAAAVPVAVPIAIPFKDPPAPVLIQTDPTDERPFELGDLLSRKWISRNIGIVSSFLLHLTVLLLLSMFLVSVGTGKVMVVLEMIAGPEMEEIVGVDTKIELDLGDHAENDELSEAANDAFQDAIGEMNDVGQEISPFGKTATAGDRQSGGGDGKSAKFFGMRSSGNSFVFVLDCSGSMDATTRLRSSQSDKDFGALRPVSRFDVARSELMNSIENLQPHQEFYAVLFSARCTGCLTTIRWSPSR